MEIRISRDGEEFGPYTWDDIHAFLQVGDLDESDWAWHEGAESWRPLAELLRNGSPPPPAEPAPPVIETVHSVAAPAPLVPRPPVEIQPMTPPEVGRDLPARRPPDVVVARNVAARDDDEDDDEDLSITAAFGFPFGQKDWPVGLLWVSLINFIPVVNLILLRGWRLDIIRRVGTHKKRQLPQLRHFARFGANGMVLWLMTFLYNIPLLFLGAFFGISMLDVVVTLGWWFLRKLVSADGVETLSEIMTGFALSEVMGLIIPILYFFTMWPVYRAAVMRFAVTRRFLVFFDFFGNLKIVLGNLHQFALLFFFDVFMTRVVLAVVTAILVATVFGSVLVLTVVIPMYYWATGYLYGTLAAKIHDEIGIAR